MTLTIGMLNIMPKAHEYVPYLLDTFCSKPDVHPRWLKLATHGYSSTPKSHMEPYRTWQQVRPEQLDGLVLTGAPVEHLPYDHVRYWPELTTILDSAAAHGIPVMGICWGGMVVAHRMGIAPEFYQTKCFGVFPAASHTVNVSGNPDGTFVCAQSRFAGLDRRSTEKAVSNGTATLIADSTDCGPFIVESPDRLLLGHLGHMEYPAERIAMEYHRDLSAGRTDVDKPVGMDPDNPRMEWLSHRHAVVDRWMETIRLARQTRRSGTEVTQ